ncbi:Receptor-type tyrosine-protein phosphatase F, partial [Anabarilius grahami]
LPNFIKSPEDQTGISGGVASFVCHAAGEPKPKISWKKKGKKVSSQRFEVIEFDDGSGSVLRIQPLRTHRDEAIYECSATNSVGEINTSANLTVLEAALHTQQPEERSLPDAMTSNMDVIVIQQLILVSPGYVGVRVEREYNFLKLPNENFENHQAQMRTPLRSRRVPNKNGASR